MSNSVGAVEAPVSSDAVAAPAPAVKRPAPPKVWWHHFAAGQVGGAVGMLVCFPLDTVKVRLQASPGAYTGMFNCFRTMMKQEGMLSLYRGLTPPLLGYAAINATAFGTYGTMKEVLHTDKSRPITLSATVAAACVAGVVQSFVRSPIERVKTLMQVRKNPDGSKYFRSTWHCISHSVRTGGLFSVFGAGLSATIVREAPQYMIYYPVYEFAKKMLTPPGEETADLSPLRTLGAGIIAGVAQWLPPMYCVDVVKSRVQAAPVGAYKNLMDCTRRAYAAEGWRVFFRGLTPALLRAGCLHGPIFMGYEVTMKLLALTNDGEDDDDR